MKNYHTTHSIEIVETGYLINLQWLDETDTVICSGSAIVSRDAEAYVPFLASDIRIQHENLFEDPAQEGVTDEI